MSTELATPDSDLDAQVAAWHAKRTAGYATLKQDARASYKAMREWGTVHSVEEWETTVKEAALDRAAGTFLLKRLGAERYIDPELTAALLALRAHLAPSCAEEELLIDSALLAYYHQLRITGWIGNLSLLVEAEFFGQAGPKAKLKEHYGYTVEGLQVEDLLKRMSEQLVPLLERSNRMLVRNLAALREQRKAPAVTIASAGQVNVAQRQVNVKA